MNAPYTGRTRIGDDRLARQIRRLASEWIEIPFDSIASGQRVEQWGTYTFGTYTTGGVVIPGLASAVDVTMQPWTDLAGTVYLFSFGSGAMRVADWTGTEIANGTDLSDIANHPYRAIVSTAVAPSAQRRLTGVGRILAVQLEAGTAFTGNSSNYWTVTAYLRSMVAPSPEAIGKTLGSLSTQRLSLVAQDPEPIYAAELGTPFSDSDRLVVSAAATGTPGPILGAVVWAKIQREVM